MPHVSLTPDLNPSTVSKTIDHNSPHTAGHLNLITQRLVGGNRVLSGLSIVQDAPGVIYLMPGAFVADGVIVTLKLPVQIDYESLLVDGLMPAGKSLVLYGYCEDAALTSEIAFGVVLDDDIESVTGDGYVHIALRVPKDSRSESGDAGRWARVYGFSSEDLARDLREGVQVLASSSFSSESGLQFSNPEVAGAYFTHDEQLLVFADRFLLPSDKMDATRPVRYGRSDVRGIKETLVSASAFDYGGKYDDAYSLLDAQWGFVVTRDVAWRTAYHYPSVGGPATVTVPEYVPGSNRLVVFENGLPLAPSEVVETDGTTLTVAWVPGAYYDFVCFKDIVFREVHTVLSSDIEAGAPRDVDLELSDHLVDTRNHTILTFVRVTTPSGASADGGYLQLGRGGTATRSGQAVKVSGGVRLLDAGTVRLGSVEMIDGAEMTVVLLAIRGSANVGVGGERAVSYGPFHTRLRASAGSPSTGEFRACPAIDAFAYEAPGASSSLKLALHEVGDDEMWNGVELPADFFSEYTLEQGPTFNGEVSTQKAPRRISRSTVVAYAEPSGLNRSYGLTTVTVPSGAAALAAGDSVRLSPGRLIEGLPKYQVGSKRLRVSLSVLAAPGRHEHGSSVEMYGSRMLIRDVDFTEVSDTSIILRAHTVPGQYMEAWVE